MQPMLDAGILTAMFLYVLAVLLQTPITPAPIGSWGGKAWAGITVGATERDLKKQVANSKTVGPDPASIRILTDKKGWIVAGILTDVNNKGNLAGFTLEMERDEPIESLEALQTELGNQDFSSYARVRYSDWFLAVWKDKGIAAVVRNGNRPIVQKVLLAPPATLVQNLDLWGRDPSEIRFAPRIPVTGIDIDVTADPRDSSLEDVCRRVLRRDARRLMDSYNGPGWAPASRDGSRIRVSMRIRKKNDFTIDGSVSLSYRDELADITNSESESGTTKREVEVADRADSIFDDLITKLSKSIDEKYRKLAWQAEWRPFSALCKPKPFSH